MSYVNAHLTDLGLTKRDLGTFSLRKDYVDVAGIHHLSYTQSVARHPGVRQRPQGQRHEERPAHLVAGFADLRTRRSGRPAPARRRASPPPAPAPLLRRTSAARPRPPAKLASRDGTTRWKNHDSARLVYFLTSSGLRLGWATYVQAQGGDALNYQHVIDAADRQRPLPPRHRRTSTAATRGLRQLPGRTRRRQAQVVNLSRRWLHRRVKPTNPTAARRQVHRRLGGPERRQPAQRRRDGVEVPGTPTTGTRSTS